MLRDRTPLKKEKKIEMSVSFLLSFFWYFFFVFVCLFDPPVVLCTDNRRCLAVFFFPLFSRSECKALAFFKEQLKSSQTSSPPCHHTWLHLPARPTHSGTLDSVRNPDRHSTQCIRLCSKSRPTHSGALDSVRNPDRHSTQCIRLCSKSRPTHSGVLDSVRNPDQHTQVHY